MRLDVLKELENFRKVEIKNLNKSELARRFNCDRRTINKYLQNNVNNEKKKRNIKTKLEGFEEIIIDKVDNYAVSSTGVFKFIKNLGYEGSYSTVNNFVKKRKDKKNNKATIRFETHPGLQAQVDWKEKLKMISKHGEIFEINIFLMVQGYSRMKYLEITTDRSQKTLFSCLTNSFEYFQGISKEILFDNMSSVVNRAKSSYRNVHINTKFQQFANDAGFKIKTCLAYRPQTKGKVESLAKLVNRLKVYNEEFESYEQLKEIVKNFNKEINEEKSQAINDKPINRFRKEKEHLIPFNSKELLSSYFHHEKEYKVSNESMIKYKGKKYSVPTRYIGKYLTVLENQSNLYIYYTKDLIVCHKIKNKILNYKKSHVREILESNAYKHKTDYEIEDLIENRLKEMDMILEE